MPFITLLQLLASEQIGTTVPMTQLFLGAIGVAFTVSYAIHRERLTRNDRSRSKCRSALLFTDSLRQWLGGEHNVGPDARIAGK